MSKKHKKFCKVLNYIEHLFILIAIVTGCVSISAFTSLVDIPIVITAGIKKNKSIIKEKRKHDKIVLLAKSELKSMDVLISKALIDSNNNHDEFFLRNNVLKEFYGMKEEIKNKSLNYI